MAVLLVLKTCKWSNPEKIQAVLNEALRNADVIHDQQKARKGK